MTEQTARLEREPTDRFVDETLAIARRGEGRAGNLEVVGWALVTVAVTSIIGSLLVAIATGESLSTDQQIAVFVGGTCGALCSLVAAAMFLGFASLIRNSSRTLEVLTLDSSLLE